MWHQKASPISLLVVNPLVNLLFPRPRVSRKVTKGKPLWWGSSGNWSSLNAIYSALLLFRLPLVMCDQPRGFCHLRCIEPCLDLYAWKERKGFENLHWPRNSYIVRTFPWRPIFMRMGNSHVVLSSVNMRWKPWKLVLLTSMFTCWERKEEGGENRCRWQV